MCGIAGIIDFHRPPDEAILRRMLGRIVHRGPDSLGIYLDRMAGLASARLRIIDLHGGDQPIHNEDRSIWVVYNGEVFNYPDLREDLVKRGHRFTTNTDTETLVHLYEEKEADFLPYLNGQFAFALWDKKKETLLLGRDRLGVRPLFYWVRDGRLLFGSEIKTIFSDPTVSRAIEEQTLADIFTGWAPLGNASIFKDVFQLAPGTYAKFSAQEFTHRQYWKLSFPPPQENGESLDSLTEALQDLLVDATRIRLRADVQVGAYLSGGLDSTYITSIVKKLFNNRLCTFSVTFRDERFNEASFQEEAIRSLETDHRNIFCRENDIGEIFPKVIWHTEVPILRTAPAPLFMLSRLVRENHFKVILTGEGADEMFGGYDIFKEDRVRRFMARDPSSRMRPLLLQRLYPDIFLSRGNRAQAYLGGFFRKGITGVDSPEYSHRIRWENTSQMRGYFSRAFLAETGNMEGFVNRFVCSLPEEFMQWDPLSRAQYTEITIFLSNYLLSSQGDRMAMAHSVEGRFPFLDHRVVEFACRVPPRYRLNGLKEKFLLRRAASGFVPPALAQRPKKPYRAPISRCFVGDGRPDYVNELLAERAIRDTGIFDADKVKRLLEKCQRQNGDLLSERENMALVGILSTQLVHHLFIQNFSGDCLENPGPIRRFEEKNPSSAAHLAKEERG